LASIKREITIDSLFPHHHCTEDKEVKSTKSSSKAISFK
jgi:hypothetical protein